MKKVCSFSPPPHTQFLPSFSRDDNTLPPGEKRIQNSKSRWAVKELQDYAWTGHFSSLAHVCVWHTTLGTLWPSLQRRMFWVEGRRCQARIEKTYVRAETGTPLRIQGFLRRVVSLGLACCGKSRRCDWFAWIKILKEMQLLLHLPWSVNGFSKTHKNRTLNV